jgi:hypothetical protein
VRARHLTALLLCLCAATGWAQPKSDWERLDEERDWKEAETALPSFPRREDRLPFAASATSDFHFFVDRSSISVGADGVVRYTLIAVSPLGVENVSFGGLRCKSGEYKTYAIGRRDGSWSRREGVWRRGTQRWQTVLRAEYFCPLGVTIATGAEGIDALRRGGHPNQGHTNYD